MSIIIVNFATNEITQNLNTMATTKRFLAVIVALAFMLPAMAQFSFGPRLGVNVNKLHFDESILNTDNRAGFNGGLEVEFMIPMLNFGFDLSAMYVHRVAQASLEAGGNEIAASKSSDYIEIPLNLKYKIGLPVVGNIVAPYIFTGPSFAFLTSKKAVSEFFEKNTCDIAWNVGAGVQLFKHLQIGASYGFGMTKVVKNIKTDFEGANIDGKNRYWTITAAWLF